MDTLPAPLALPAPTPALPAAPTLGAAELLGHWLSGRSPRTREAYVGDLKDFVKFVSLDPAATVDDVVRWFLALGHGAANANALMYRNHMLDDRKLATATVARRLAALRSVVSLANTLGMASWSLSIDSPTVESRRDMRGPDAHDLKKLWKSLKAKDTPKGRHDLALFALMFDLGLRRGSVASIDLADVDLADGSIRVAWKGRREKVRRTLPGPTRDAVQSWIEARGDRPGPLFVAFLKGGKPTDNRLTGDGIEHIARKVGERARLARRLRPHGMRHAAATELRRAGADMETIQAFLGHARPETTQRYIDSDRDRAAEGASIVSKLRK